MSSRRWCFTLHDYTDQDERTIQQINCRYLIYGRELCPTTGRRHLQGYINYGKPYRFNAIKTEIGTNVHLEKAKGNDSQNRIYCSKSGDVYEKGEPTSQGKREDLKRVVDEVVGKESSPGKVARTYPETFIRYHRGIRELFREHQRSQQRNWITNVHVYIGPPGCEKTRRAYAECGNYSTKPAFWKEQGEWWDGYSNQECVIIDEYYGTIPYSQFLRILDRYPMQVPIKGGYQTFKAKHIWITSNAPIDRWYSFPHYKEGAIMRRITTYLEWKIDLFNDKLYYIYDRLNNKIIQDYPSL